MKNVSRDTIEKVWVSRIFPNPDQARVSYLAAEAAEGLTTTTN